MHKSLKIKTQTDWWKSCLYLCIISDVEEVEREDVVFGPDHEPSFLLVQQEGVVRWAVGQAFKCHQVVRLQHFCRGKGKQRVGEQIWWSLLQSKSIYNSDLLILFPVAKSHLWFRKHFQPLSISMTTRSLHRSARKGCIQWGLGESHEGSISTLKKIKQFVWAITDQTTQFFLSNPSVLTFFLLRCKCCCNESPPNPPVTECFHH